ncbi:unnamed protein product [Peniophora sp. CBMAI 1063]|nr:unnamed protein product [Peniophora sp. CBMAI 1063]
MSPPMIVSTAYAPYHADDFANGMLVRYEQRVVDTTIAILRFRAGLDVFRPNQPCINKPLYLVRWRGAEPRRGELLWAIREQDAAGTAILVMRGVVRPSTRPILVQPHITNLTILNVAPPAEVEDATPEQPSAAPAVQRYPPHEAQAVSTVIGTQDPPPAPVKEEDRPVNIATGEERETIDLTMSDDEEDIKPTIHELEEQEASTSSRPARPTLGVQMKLATCPSKAEIRAMVRYVASKPSGTDMRKPEQWMDFDPRRGIFAWAKIYTKRKDDIGRLVVDLRRKNRCKRMTDVKQGQ